MEAYESLLTRRSVRKYRPDPVPQELIDKIMTAGLYAATGMGYQDTIVLQIKNEKIKSEIIALNREIGGFSPDADPFYGAPVILVVLADKSRPNHVYDGTLMMGSLMQAAHALGLGSCWIHRAKQEFETDWGRKLLSDLGIEGEWEGIGHCAVGYIDGEAPKAPARKPGRICTAE